MKNYKHSVKSGNAMKLAAVASAAIMMAPVALNSVSTFASYTPVTGTATSATTSTTTADFAADAKKTTENANTAISTLKAAWDKAANTYNSTHGATRTAFTKDIQAALADKDAIKANVASVTAADSKYAKAATTAQDAADHLADYEKDVAANPKAHTAATMATVKQEAAAAKNDYNLAKIEVNKAVAQAVLATTRINALTAEMTAKTPAGALQASIAAAQKKADALKSTNPGYAAVINAAIKTANVALAANDANAEKNPKSSMSYAKSQLDGTVARISNEIAAGTAAAAKKQSGVAHINYVKGYGIQVWTKDHKIVKNADGSAKKLGGETNWKVFGPAVKISGQTYYCVGGNQFIDAAYVTFTAIK